MPSCWETVVAITVAIASLIFLVYVVRNRLAYMKNFPERCTFIMLPQSCRYCGRMYTPKYCSDYWCSSDCNIKERMALKGHVY